MRIAQHRVEFQGPRDIPPLYADDDRDDLPARITQHVRHHLDLILDIIGIDAGEQADFELVDNDTTGAIWFTHDAWSEPIIRFTITDGDPPARA